MRIGIIGCRQRNGVSDYLAVARVFYDIYRPGDIMVSGGCKEGGDRFGEALADSVGADKIIHYPDKSKLDIALMQWNPSAAYAKINYARNTLVAADSEFLIAAVAPDRKGGTEDTIKKWLRLHKGHGQIRLV